MRRLKHMLLRLSAEEKVIGIGSLAVLLSVFMPWYSVILTFEKEINESGFSGDLGVMGFVVFLITLISLGFLMGDHLHFRLPRFGFGKESIILFFSAESAFLLLLEVAIFTKRSLDYTNAEIRFGLYTALVGSVLATFAAFAQLQKLHKKEANAFFEHEPEPLAEQMAEPELTESEEPAPEEPVVEKAKHAKRHQVVSEGGRPVIQELFFEEEKIEEVPEEAIEAASEETMEEEAPFQAKIASEETITVSETILNDELTEVEEKVETELKITEAPEETIIDITETVEKKEPAQGQGNYFLRDADITPNVEIREVEKKPEAPTAQPARTSGFYDDL